jgi:mycothiol synthase
MRTPRVLREFAPGDVALINRLASDVEVATGIDPLGDDARTGLLAEAAGRDRGLLVANGAEPEAYAHLAQHHPGEWSLEVVVRGTDSELESTLVVDALDVVAKDGGGRVTWWVHGATDEDDEVAGAAGFELERDLLQLRVPLPLTVPFDWPAGVTVRAFVPGRDDADWIAVNNRAFADHPEQGGWTLATLRLREAEPWFDPDGFLLAHDHGNLVGFCWTKLHPARPPREPDVLGEIYVIGSDPAHQGRGLGRALTSAGLAWLADHGAPVGMLFVDAASTAAIGLYRSLGFVDHRADRAYARDVAGSPA